MKKPTKAQRWFLQHAAQIGGEPIYIGPDTDLARECVWNGWGHSRKSGKTGDGPECFWINAKGLEAIGKEKG